MSAKRLKTVVRFDPAFKAALEEAASADFRSVASLIEKVMADYLKKQGYLPVSATTGITPPPGTLFDTVADQMEQTAKPQVKEAALKARSPDVYVDTCSIAAISSDGSASKQQPTSQPPIDKPPAIDRFADLLFGVRRTEDK
jgi:hypothetical protein